MTDEQTVPGEQTGTDAQAPELTVAQQASLTSGADFWTTKSAPGVPAIMLTDGPHGLRKQEGSADHLGLSGSVPATCFPPAVGLAQTWNPELAARVGAALGDEARAQDVGVLLGPGINIKRSPLGGRNFEYFSEDPHLTARMGAAWVRGLQSRGVGASLKHFAANNQETDRMRVSADVDPRCLHEIYLRAFRHIVTTAQPWTVMCSYNRINGVHACEDHELLTTTLRDQWGFEGLVVSDWGAVVDRVRAVAAGLDLTMPFGGDAGDAAVAAAAADGTLDPDALRASAGRVAALARRATDSDRPAIEPLDLDAHHALAREVAGQAITLLRNDGTLLPLADAPDDEPDPASSLAVIGALAVEPRFQGAGSSKVNATRVDVPLESIRSRAGREVAFAPGYHTGRGDRVNSEDTVTLADEAVAVARSASTVVLFLGLAAHQESEGFDRTDIDLPVDQIALAARVLDANPRTVVVLCHGGVVRVAPIAAPAILDAALLGQAVGSAIADVLFGDVNPSGRLAETLPVRLADSPAYLNFPGEHGHVVYGEGVFVGYRWYDARDLDVSYPFGHGLSYTTFEYSGLSVEVTDEGLAVSLTVTNTGSRDGREVVQVYVGAPDSAVARPPRELKGFTSIAIPVGSSVPVTITVDRDDLAHWDTRVDEFVVEGGTHTVSVGASSRDLRLTTTVDIPGDGVHIPLTLDSTVAEVLADPVAAQAMKPITDAMLGSDDDTAESTDDTLGIDMATMMASVPVARLVGFSGGQLTVEMLQQILDAANAAED